jgi:hypothetical protein
VDAVTLALASVITSGVVGISGIGAGLWTSRQTANLARETRSQERLANAYLEVLSSVERQGQWFQSRGDNLVARTDPYFSGPTASFSRPELGERSRAKALLGAFGSTQVKNRYLAWTLAAASIDEEHRLLEWNWYEDGGDPNRPIDPTTLKTLLEKLQPAEVEVREALASAMARELGVAESHT